MEQINMLFSIIIPVYNVEEYLDRCIESIQRQECKDFEIIIIDDSSTDHTLQAAKKAKEKYGNIVIIEQDHAGQATARNKGIAAAKGAYIVFIDGDDYVEPGYLAHLQRLIETSQPDLCMAANFYSVQAGEKTRHIAIRSDKPTEYGTPEILFRDGKMPSAMWLMTVKCSVILEHQINFSEELLCNEDFDFIMKVVRFSQSVVLYEGPYYNYFRDNETSTYAKINGDKIFSYMMPFRKWFDYFSRYADVYPYSQNARKCIARGYRWAYYQLIDLPIRDPYFKKDILFLWETKYVLEGVLPTKAIVLRVFVEKIRRKIHRVGHLWKEELKGRKRR
jgi:glycosyltransferase involved in cell wall biosynthesis